ncbi:MAG: carbohydrate-binding protein [Bacteroidales bacterium]|nr:carbohydrate-binding protein [Bacteroidales bacterium]
MKTLLFSVLIALFTFNNKTTAQDYSGTPYGGTALQIPGTIEAENYDDGGEGIAYHDDDVAQQGVSNGNFRPTEGVDVEKTVDISGGYNIGWISSTEWLRYSVDVATAGSYKLEIRYATGITDCAIGFSFVSGEDNVTGSIPAPTTGGWGIFNWVNTTVQLKAGPQVMIINPGVNINYYTLTLIPPTNTSIPYTGTPWSIPGTIEAENYDAGGEGIAYHDDAVVQQGASNGNFRPTEGVDVEATQDVSGGYNIGWTSSTEWLRYSVDVATAGSYNLGIRYATGVADCSVGFSYVSDADNVSGSIPAPTTGSWDNFDWVNATVQLKAGPQVMIINPGVNINYYTLTPIISTGVTGIESNSLFNLYPNPANEILNIKMTDYKNVDLVQIFDLAGVVVKSTKFKQEISSIDLSDLTRGIYFVRVTSGNITKTQKFTKR